MIFGVIDNWLIGFMLRFSLLDSRCYMLNLVLKNEIEILFVFH